MWQAPLQKRVLLGERVAYRTVHETGGKPRTSVSIWRAANQASVPLAETVGRPAARQKAVWPFACAIKLSDKRNIPPKLVFFLFLALLTVEAIQVALRSRGPAPFCVGIARQLDKVRSANRVLNCFAHKARETGHLWVNFRFFALVRLADGAQRGIATRH